MTVQIANWKGDLPYSREAARFQLETASVTVRDEKYGSYITVLCWQMEGRGTLDTWYSCWIVQPGINNYKRLPYLDCRTPASVGRLVVKILDYTLSVDRDGAVSYEGMYI